MGRKIIKEEKVWFEEKGVVYDDSVPFAKRVGEVRCEQDFFGREVKVAYNSDGKRIGEVRHEGGLEVVDDEKGRRVWEMEREYDHDYSYEADDSGVGGIFAVVTYVALSPLIAFVKAFPKTSYEKEKPKEEKKKIARYEKKPPGRLEFSGKKPSGDAGI
jgi:hypothetical protein